MHGATVVAKNVWALQVAWGSFLPSSYPGVRLRNFWRLASHEIPSGPGVYVLLAKPGTRFQYPRGRSPVFYIGQASNLGNRLRSHLRYSLQARGDRPLKLYWRRYEYAAVFGCRYTYISAHRGDPGILEAKVLSSFADRYRSIPVANGGGGWGG